jgi:mannosylglycerate hydrolase
VGAGLRALRRGAHHARANPPGSRACCAGELVTTYKVELDWELPRGRSADEKRRSADRVPCKIVNMVTLRKGQPWVEIETTIENNAEDHYLQVSFPTRVESETTIASTPFDVVERSMKLPDPGKYDEDLQTEHPMDRFVAIEDGKAGVALLNEGLKAYEPHDDDDQTISLTMLRCFPLRICITNLEMTDYSNQDNGSQCLGTHTFKYAFQPYAGTTESAGIWQSAERFNHAVRVAQIGPSGGGSLPMKHSFLEVENAALHVSAVKQSETAKAGWCGCSTRPTRPSAAGSASTVARFRRRRCRRSSARPRTTPCPGPPATSGARCGWSTWRSWKPRNCHSRPMAR